MLTMSSSQNQFVQFFETVIRYLGGMLSAYAMTDNPIYLAHADELGSQLLPIFNTTYGLTPFSVNMRTYVAFLNSAVTRLKHIS